MILHYEFNGNEYEYDLESGSDGYDYYLRLAREYLEDLYDLENEDEIEEAIEKYEDDIWDAVANDIRDYCYDDALESYNYHKDPAGFLGAARRGE